MLLNKNVEIYVYQVDDTGTFDAIGEINQFTSLMWPDKYVGSAKFELWAPITEENRQLIKEGRIVWCGGDQAAVIEIIETTTDENGQKNYDIKGRTLEMFLTTRIIWGTYTCSNKVASTAMYEIVNQQCVNPTQAKRKIPFLVCDTDAKVGAKITTQKTGGEVYDALSDICSDTGLGFDVLFRPKEKKLIFRVTQGLDRTTSQSTNKPVVLSTELEDVLSSSYYKNTQDQKTVALVAGEDSGESRKQVISGDDAIAGFLRREMYIDARDVQSEVYGDDGSISYIPEDEYLAMLNNRGDEKLAEAVVTETFDAKTRVIGHVQHVYGVDYHKGDKITVEDAELGIRVNAIVDEASENFDDEYELTLTFGYSYPSLMKRIRNKIGR